ncbi:hypothetical protein DNTS_023630 [Danionella cerebrum]|uniref:Ubiquitin-activating enzyme E1 C-terminal domain-containing protein n=1 Tax=Danionella cerebrum TaxID=2873325 RepID=A0A553QKW0_9TELE|nr:hypothetical protein DNTS_023630 [Danionella translucida]
MLPLLAHIDRLTQEDPEIPSPLPTMADSMDIDDSLYSRQRYVLGDCAMHQMARSTVFVSGMGALGVEIAKNIVLAGVKAVTLHDNKRCEPWDLGTNFFIREEDVQSQKKRVEAVHQRVAELNPYVRVSVSTDVLDDQTDLSFLKMYQCVVLTETKLSLQKRVNRFCHSQQPSIKAFEVSDPTGEESKEIFIQNISQGNPGVVMCMDSRTHGLQTGQSVFAIGDTSTFQPYAHGGFFRLVKIPKTFSFEMMEQQLSDPLLLTPDFSKPEDAELLFNYTQDISKTLKNKVDVNQDLVRCVSRCARGCLFPLAAAVSGIASQEVLKALTGKFSPLQQWFYLDALEVVQPLQSLPVEEFIPRGDRYDALRACIGHSLCMKLHTFRVFMVGCGAIGCEMLKNLALLGICVTDPDLIEKSNLNRQFLFRPHHIQKPKSTTAAEATLEINPELRIQAHLNKVCPATEEIYNDVFFSRLNVVVTALDNVEARRYVDSRSVSNQKALLDSGTMGTKGHTEIIVPNLTESYNSHRDPPEEEIPFCTLKSFPAFESAFSHKPSMYNMFWHSHSPAQDVLRRMIAGESMEGSFQVIKLLSRRPTQWEHCLTLARLKFDKYFKKKALQLLHSFPLDTRLKDGSLFWQSPKRPPAPIEFDLSDPLHFSFIVSAARLFAGTYNILYSEEKLSHEAVSSVLAEVEVPEYKPAEKRLRMTPLFFEKDDDSNGHMDFVASASALRARMYAIEAADRLETKRIAGKIIPAIATSTAAVAGLVSMELIKIAGGYGFELFKNCFFNLAIPVVVLTETAPEKYGIEPTMVVHGVKMLYVPVMPGHNKRLKLTMHKLIKPSAGRKYVDLIVSFAPELDGDEDLPGPPVRYYFSRESEGGQTA